MIEHTSVSNCCVVTNTNINVLIYFNFIICFLLN